MSALYIQLRHTMYTTTMFTITTHNVYTYIHAYIHIYIYIYTHNCIYMFLSLSFLPRAASDHGKQCGALSPALGRAKAVRVVSY